LNILLILLILIAAWRFVDGYKNGVVKEIISVITLIILAIATVLLSKIVGFYVQKQIINMALAIILFMILCLAHSGLRFVFFSAKLVSKLPVVSFVNRIIGAVFGIFEALLFAWVIFSLNMYMDLGVLGEEVVLFVKDSAILTFIYERNYLAYEISKFIPLGAKFDSVAKDAVDTAVDNAVDNVKDALFENIKNRIFGE